MNTQLEHDLYDFICSDFANYERQDIAGRSIRIEYVLGYKQAGTINFKFKNLVIQCRKPPHFNAGI